MRVKQAAQPVLHIGDFDVEQQFWCLCFLEAVVISIAHFGLLKKAKVLSSPKRLGKYQKTLAPGIKCCLCPIAFLNQKLSRY
jgi:hypothetical protein